MKGKVLFRSNWGGGGGGGLSTWLFLRAAENLTRLIIIQMPHWCCCWRIVSGSRFKIRWTPWLGRSGRAPSGAGLRALLSEAIHTLRAIPTRLAIFTASFQGIIIIARGSRVGCGCSAPNVQLPGCPWISSYTTFWVCSSSEIDANTRFARGKYS